MTNRKIPSQTAATQDGTIPKRLAVGVIFLALLLLAAVLCLGAYHAVTRPVKSVNRANHPAVYLKDNMLMLLTKSNHTVPVARLHQDDTAISQPDADAARITVNGKYLFYLAEELDGAAMLYRCPIKKIPDKQVLVAQDVLDYEIEDFGRFAVIKKPEGLYYTDFDDETLICEQADTFAVGADRKTVVYTVAAQDGTLSLCRWHTDGTNESEMIEIGITRMAGPLRNANALLYQKNGKLYLADKRGQYCLLTGVGAQGETDVSGNHYYQLEGEENDILCRYEIKRHKLGKRRVIADDVTDFSLGSGGVLVWHAKNGKTALELYAKNKLTPISEQTSGDCFAFLGNALYYLDAYDDASGGTLTRFCNGNSKIVDTGVAEFDALRQNRVVYQKSNGILCIGGGRKIKQIDTGVRAMCRTYSIPGVGR